MLLLAILLGANAAGGSSKMLSRMDIYFSEDVWDTAASCTVRLVYRLFITILQWLSDCLEIIA